MFLRYSQKPGLKQYLKIEFCFFIQCSKVWAKGNKINCCIFYNFIQWYSYNLWLLHHKRWKYSSCMNTSVRHWMFLQHLGSFPSAVEKSLQWPDSEITSCNDILIIGSFCSNEVWVISKCQMFEVADFVVELAIYFWVIKLIIWPQESTYRLCVAHCALSLRWSVWDQMQSWNVILLKRCIFTQHGDGKQICNSVTWLLIII